MPTFIIMVHKIHLIATHVIDGQYQGGLQIEEAECVPMISNKHALFIGKFEIEKDHMSGVEDEIDEGEKQEHT